MIPNWRYFCRKMSTSTALCKSQLCAPGRVHSGNKRIYGNYFRTDQWMLLCFKFLLSKDPTRLEANQNSHQNFQCWKSLIQQIPDVGRPAMFTYSLGSSSANASHVQLLLFCHQISHQNITCKKECNFTSKGSRTISLFAWGGGRPKNIPYPHYYNQCLDESSNISRTQQSQPKPPKSAILPPLLPHLPKFHHRLTPNLLLRRSSRRLDRPRQQPTRSRNRLKPPCLPHSVPDGSIQVTHVPLTFGE